MMTQADLRLREAFAADLPPARDPAFTLAVMAKVAQRKLVFDLVSAGVMAVAAGVGLWALWPVLSQAMPLAAGAWDAVAPGAAALAGVIAILAADALIPRFGRSPVNR
jgi:hypothetical protein